MSAYELPLAINKSSLQFLSVDSTRLALADRFYREHGYKVKCTAQERVFVLSMANEWIAAARFVPQGSGHYWLRNLLVAPEYRGGGLASHLLNQVKPLIVPQGCYCFALPHLINFYTRLAFDRDPQHCPADIAAIYSRYRTRGRDWVLMGYQQQDQKLFYPIHK